MITRALETAQKRIEGFNFDARKQVLAYDNVLNHQRITVYARRRSALLGSPEEIRTLAEELIDKDETAHNAYEAKRKELGDDVFTALLRRLVLQVTDAFWLEQLETMEYLRRSVSLRAYGQRDPLIEYRREGLSRFRAMEEGIARTVTSAISRIVPADDTRMRKEEERVRASLAGASEGSTPPPLRVEHRGRNDLVTIRKGSQTQTLKWKRAEPLLKEGWVFE